MPIKAPVAVRSVDSALTRSESSTLASLLSLAHSPWWLAFTGFVGAASIAFAATGFCPVANVLYWLGFEPRLEPVAIPTRSDGLDVVDPRQGAARA